MTDNEKVSGLRRYYYANLGCQSGVLSASWDGLWKERGYKIMEKYPWFSDDQYRYGSFYIWDVVFMLWCFGLAKANQK